MNATLCCPLVTRSLLRAPALDRIGVLLLDETDWEEIRGLVSESYRVLAPKKLTALLYWRAGRRWRVLGHAVGWRYSVWDQLDLLQRTDHLVALAKACREAAR